MAVMPDVWVMIYLNLKRALVPSSICAALLWCLLGLQCTPRVTYIPDPEKDIDDWVRTFSQQRSFTYHYILKTQAVMAEASGECVIGRGEHIEGVWRGDTVVEFEYVGFGDVEWSREDGAWQKRVRGEQSDFFAQIMRVLEFDKFEYRGFENGYVYDFKATVPFLSPGGWKEIRGVLRISDRMFLPAAIWVGLPDSSVFWHMELSHYNARKSIDAPVKNSAQYVLSGISGAHGKAVDQRLTLLGVEHRIGEHDGAVILTVPEYYSTDDVQTMLSAKHLVVYEVIESQEQALKVGYLHGDESEPVYLADTFATAGDINGIRVRFDVRSRPFLEIQLKEKHAAVHSCAYEVDGEVVGVATLDTRGKIDRIRMYTSMSYYDLQVLRAALLEPLPPVQATVVTEDSN